MINRTKFKIDLLKVFDSPIPPKDVSVKTLRLAQKAIEDQLGADGQDNTPRLKR